MIVKSGRVLSFYRFWSHNNVQCIHKPSQYVKICRNVSVFDACIPNLFDKFLIGNYLTSSENGNPFLSNSSSITSSNSLSPKKDKHILKRQKKAYKKIWTKVFEFFPAHALLFISDHAIKTLSHSSI